MFKVRTVHKTNAVLDSNFFLRHKSDAELTDGDLVLYARVETERLNCFVIKNNVVEYIRAIGNDGRAMLTDKPHPLKFKNNVVDDSILIPQNDRFWSAHKNTGLFWLAPRGSAWESFFLDSIDTLELGKTKVVLVLPTIDALESARARLNLDRITVDTILINGISAAALKLISLRDEIPLHSFASLDRLLIEERDSLWFLSGFEIDVAKNIFDRLQCQGLARERIINLEPRLKPSPHWLAAVKTAAENPYDYFSIGDRNAASGLDLSKIDGANGINLAVDGQDLRQSYLTTRYVLERNREIKFVLLGLTPEFLAADEPSDRSARHVLGRYLFDSEDESLEARLFSRLLDDEINFPTEDIPSELAPDQTIVGTDFDNARDVQFDDRKFRLLEDFARLCLDHGVRLIGVLLPSRPDTYPIEKIKLLRRVLKAVAFECIDLAELPLGRESFAVGDRLNDKGATAVSNVLNWKLCSLGLLPIENLCAMTYDRLYSLLGLLGMREYDEMMSRIFSSSIENIRRKDRIKVGFALFDAAMWCGDELYRSFEQSERYEPTVFLCLRPDEKTELTDENFRRNSTLLRSRGLNVVEVLRHSKQIPKQDVLIYLTPYFGYLRRAFRPSTVTAETLITYIPYGFRTTIWDISRFKINFIGWKLFMDSNALVKFIVKNHNIDASRLVYSGLPKMDLFFLDQPTQFEWKCARPNPTKIIWAPHWSIKGFKYHRLATFQFNYKFMYEYARSHPETSWVVKPHPQLLTSAVTAGVFASTADFERYLEQWDQLPNARVIMGGYYQDIFRSSDGMILDSGSFIGEYQYTHKPMLFLRRDALKLSELGQAILDANYVVNGKDFDGIVRFIEDVLIARHDVQGAARMKVFDAELNYRKTNGMLASECIFETIDQQLRR